LPPEALQVQIVYQLAGHKGIHSPAPDFLRKQAGAARATAAQLAKFDRRTAAAAKKFIKPIPYEELQQEIDIVCDLYARPTVQAALRKFVESTDAQPYLP